MTFIFDVLFQLAEAAGDLSLEAAGSRQAFLNLRGHHFEFSVSFLSLFAIGEASAESMSL